MDEEALAWIDFLSLMPRDQEWIGVSIPVREQSSERASRLPDSHCISDAPRSTPPGFRQSAVNLLAEEILLQWLRTGVESSDRIFNASGCSEAVVRDREVAWTEVLHVRRLFCATDMKRLV